MSDDEGEILRLDFTGLGEFFCLKVAFHLGDEKFMEESGTAEFESRQTASA